MPLPPALLRCSSAFQESQNAFEYGPEYSNFPMGCDSCIQFARKPLLVPYTSILSPEDHPFDECTLVSLILTWFCKYPVQTSLFAPDSATTQTVGLANAPVTGIGVGVDVYGQYYTPARRPGDLALTLDIKRWLSIQSYVLFVVITGRS